MGLVVVAQFGYDWHLKRNFFLGGGDIALKIVCGLYSATACIQKPTVNVL